jgi:hypothetical protein
MTEREAYIPKIRQALASIETDSILKCIQYAASHHGLMLCGSARYYLESEKSTPKPYGDVTYRGNIFYWLENDAPVMGLDWILSHFYDDNEDETMKDGYA